MVMTLLIAEPVADVVNSGVITACLFISIVAAGGGASGLRTLFGKEPSVSHAGPEYHILLMTSAGLTPREGRSAGFDAVGQYSQQSGLIKRRISCTLF